MRLFLLLLMAAPRSPDTGLAHVGAGNQLLSQERFDEAAVEYQAALRLDPKLLNARRDLAVCRFELRQYEEAKELLSELLSHPSTNAMAHYYLGRIDLLEGKFVPAIAQLLSIPRAHPFRDERYFLGAAYFKSGDWEKSATTLQESVRENPRDFRAHQLLARALQTLGRRQAATHEFAETRTLLGYYTEGSQAIKRCGETLSRKNGEETAKVCGPLLTTDDVDKLAALGMLLGNNEFFEAAKTAWTRAASLDPESSEIRYDLALTCFHLKDKACARDNAKAAIDARADFPEANVLYASVLYTMGADAEALPALRRAHALSPNDNSVRAMLGNELILWAEQYAHTGKLDDARRLLSELDSLRPLGAEQERRLLELQQLLDNGQPQR
jgi:tetratricopeptide (TPR) repeat protein